MGTRMFLALVAMLAVIGISQVAFAETSCERNIQTRFSPEQVTVDGGKDQIKAAQLENMFARVFLNSSFGGGSDLRDDPLPAWMVGRTVYHLDLNEAGEVVTVGEATEVDYRFLGEIILEQPHDLLTLKVRLVDAHRGKVVEEAGQRQISWFYTNPTEVKDKTKWERRDKVEQLAQEFMPLDDIIHRYEGTPQSAQLDPKKDPIGSGETMTITMKEILDTDGKSSKEWQRVLVKVEKGTIENKVPRSGDYYVFEVGEGNIEIQYEAPDECENQTETITVQNTCEINPGRIPLGGDDEIATKEFEIVCLKGRLEATLNPDYTIPYQESYNIVEEHPATLPFRLETTDDPEKFEVVVDDDFVEGTVKTKRVIVYEQGSLTFEVHVLRTRAIRLRVPEGDVDLKRPPERTLYFHIDLRVFDPEEISWSKRPIAHGPAKSKETLSDSDWWFAHQFWTPVVEDHTKDVGVYRYRMHLEPETVEYLLSVR